MQLCVRPELVARADACAVLRTWFSRRGRPRGETSREHSRQGPQGRVPRDHTAFSCSLVASLVPPRCPVHPTQSNGEVCPRLRILPFLFCSTTQGFLLFYLSLDSPSQVPLLLRYSDSLPRLSHLGPAFSFLILHSRFLRFLSDSLGQPEPIPDSAPPSRFSCLSSYS